MKEDGDIASDGLHSSKRLRLSIPRGRSRSLPDSAGASTSSSPANLPSIGATANVSESSIEAEPALVSDLEHSLQNTDGDTALRSEEYFSDIRQQFSEAGNGLQDVPSEVPDAVTDQLRELRGMQLEEGTSISLEPVAEVSAVASDDSVGHDDPSSSGGEETRDALQGGEVSGGGQEQEANLAAVQEMESEVRPPVSQQQDEALPHNVATHDQVVTLDLRREYDVLEANLEILEGPMTESAILHTEARDQVVETVVLSEDELEAESADPTLTASAFAEPVLTAEDFDAFAPEPHRIPQHLPRGSTAEAGTSNPEQLATQLDSEGTLCPICMEPWTSTGEHRICCLACGHLFGMFCIKRWLKQAARKQGKCPQCNKKARVEDIRTLFVSRVAVINGETQEYMQEAGSLRNENEQLRKQVVDLREEVQQTRSLIKALAGNQHGAFNMFSSSILRPLDQRGQHASESRRHSIAQNAARAALHRAHGSVNHDHSNPQSGRSTRERPFLIEHGWNITPNGWGSPPLPEDHRNLRQFDETISLGTGAHTGMVGDLEQRSEGNSSLRSGPSIRERPFLAERGWNIRPPNGWGSPPLPQDQQTSLRRFSLNLSLGMDPHARMTGDLEQRREENRAARPLRSFTALTPAEVQGVEQGFVIQGDRPLNGAKAFDMDAHSQLVLVSGKPADSMTSSGLKKMSLMDFWEGECINLPPGTGAIRDIRIAPTGTSAPGRLALVASLGKKLSLFSLESNNVVITYTLPHPSWACAWDLSDPNRVFTGLQNGTLLSFDVRQTSSPLETFKGPSSTPIHTLQYVRGGGLLSASSNSLLLWPDIDAQEKRPVCLYQPGGPSVCVSVSYNAAVDVMVASFRPKPTLNDGATSSTPSTYSQADVTSQSTPSVASESASVSVRVPTHFCYVRTSRSVAAGTWEQQGALVGHRSQTVLSRTAIVNEWTGAVAGQSCLFASGDEGSNSVWLWDLASPTARQMLSPHPSPVLDIRTAHIANASVDLLGCISERKLQLYKRSSPMQ